MSGSSSICKRHGQIWSLPRNFRETVEGGILVVRLGSRQVMKLKWFSIQAPVLFPQSHCDSTDRAALRILKAFQSFHAALVLSCFNTGPFTGIRATKKDIAVKFSRRRGLWYPVCSAIIIAGYQETKGLDLGQDASQTHRQAQSCNILCIPLYSNFNQLGLSFHFWS